MSRVYVGNLDPRASERDLEDEFRVYGVLRSGSPFTSWNNSGLVLLWATIFCRKEHVGFVDDPEDLFSSSALWYP
ncbi:Serine/arginine-rich splicing factor [Nymphaea thermarum]|nr:Serine/arginine-rich splicing factor [Nymphaea thermarum]